MYLYSQHLTFTFSLSSFYLFIYFHNYYFAEISRMFVVVVAAWGQVFFWYVKYILNMLAWSRNVCFLISYKLYTRSIALHTFIKRSLIKENFSQSQIKITQALWRKCTHFCIHFHSSFHGILLSFALFLVAYEIRWKCVLRCSE